MSTQQVAGSSSWPKLPGLDDWQDAFATLHMWTQIAGKIRLGLFPPVNHYWGCTLYVSSRGLTTMPIPCGASTFTIDFDFIAHELQVAKSDGDSTSFRLEPMSVALFYAKLMAHLAELNILVKIYPRPAEVVEAIPFAEDTLHASYDPDSVNRIWRALVMIDQVLSRFRSEFIGKSSPVHFFWGAFDLAVTRFSGRAAPKHPGGAPNCPDRVMVEAYSHEVSSAGFWPGAGLGEAAFYSYAYPTPDGFAETHVEPQAAHWNDALREFVLPYESVRASKNPEQALLAFLRSTYEAAANLAHWDRAALERPSSASRR